MANVTRFDPLDDLFRGFFVRPVDLNGSPSHQGRRARLCPAEALPYIKRFYARPSSSSMAATP
jgi:hypothetical protein